MSKTNSTSYEVGYGRPPQEHQFRKGEPSGNPKGRPRNALLRNAPVADILNEPVTISIDGRPKRLPFTVAFLQVLKSKALQGDHKSAQLIITLLRDPGILPSENYERLLNDMRTKMMWKPEHHPLKESIEAWAAIGRGK